jgi:hypothetical protein
MGAGIQQKDRMPIRFFVPIRSRIMTPEIRFLDAYLFSVIDRTVGDETAPDLTATVVRKAPPERATAAAPPRGK